MARSKVLAVTLAVAIAISPAPASAGIPIVIPLPAPASNPGVGMYGLVGCVAGIMIAAIDAGRRFNRELTGAEAASCGLLYWINLANRRP